MIENLIFYGIASILSIFVVLSEKLQTKENSAKLVFVSIALFICFRLVSYNEESGFIGTYLINGLDVRNIAIDNEITSIRSLVFHFFITLIFISYSASYAFKVKTENT